ncbi:hypothetical protein PMZ80_009079 [Knufia obscura]|uniref:F-box domain-containing protein n=1 Tax=Knufia obscura TaxID=1635080 RepID=A0ABR0RF61_9EURO|nr:hypothetical protein PMZ80_009079 [Knufia obscura]
MARKRTAVQSAAISKRRKSKYSGDSRLSLVDLPVEVLKKIAIFTLVDNETVPEHNETVLEHSRNVKYHSNLLRTNKRLRDVTLDALLVDIPWCFIKFFGDGYTRDKFKYSVPGHAAKALPESIRDRITPTIRLKVGNEDQADSEASGQTDDAPSPSTFEALVPLEMRNLALAVYGLQRYPTTDIEIDLSSTNSAVHRQAQRYFLEVLSSICHSRSQVSVRGPPDRIPATFQPRITARLEQDSPVALHRQHAEQLIIFAGAALTRHEDAEVVTFLSHNHLRGYCRDVGPDISGDPTLNFLYIHLNFLLTQAKRNLILVRTKYGEFQKHELLFEYFERNYSVHNWETSPASTTEEQYVHLMLQAERQLALAYWEASRWPGSWQKCASLRHLLPNSTTRTRASNTRKGCVLFHHWDDVADINGMTRSDNMRNEIDHLMNAEFKLYLANRLRATKESVRLLAFVQHRLGREKHRRTLKPYCPTLVRQADPSLSTYQIDDYDTVMTWMLELLGDSVVLSDREPDRQLIDEQRMLANFADRPDILNYTGVNWTIDLSDETKRSDTIAELMSRYDVEEVEYPPADPFDEDQNPQRWKTYRCERELRSLESEELIGRIPPM